jgi:hypothetical protein
MASTRRRTSGVTADESRPTPTTQVSSSTRAASRWSPRSIARSLWSHSSSRAGSRNGWPASPEPTRTRAPTRLPWPGPTR